MAFFKRSRPSGNRPPDTESAPPGADRNESRFVEEMETRIKYYLVSEDRELDFEPMNSYKRRLIHKLATQYKLDTESRGEEPGRYVTLIKTEDSAEPTGRARPRLWDFGVQAFPVNPGDEGVRIALKVDGSVEIYNEADKRLVLDERLVTARQIRIRNGKIVTPDDAAW